MKIIFFSKEKKLKYFGLLFFLTILLTILIFSRQSIVSIQNSMKIFLTNIVPSLFPFILLSEFAQNANLFDSISEKLKNSLHRVFKLSKNCISAIIIGFTCGFPTGAKTVNTLYSSGKIDEKDAKILLSFVNNFNPAYIVSSIGILVYNNIFIGIFLMLVSYISSLLIGLIYARLNTNNIIQQNIVNSNQMRKNDVKLSNFDNLRNSILSTFISLAYIFSFLILFNLLTDLLTIAVSKFISSYENIWLFSGIFEITRGSVNLTRSSLEIGQKICYQSFLLGFGSLSIIFQIFSSIKIPKISFSYIFSTKLCHGILSAIISYILLKYTHLLYILNKLNNFKGYTYAKEVNSNLDVYQDTSIKNQLYNSLLNSLFIIILILSVYMIIRILSENIKKNKKIKKEKKRKRKAVQ